MDLNLGQLVIELAGDYSQLTKDIESAKTLALKQAKELEKNFQLSPSFDAKSLLTSADLAGVNAGKALGRGIEKSLNSYKFSNTSFKSAGDAIAQGLSQGIKNGDSQVKNSASRMAGLVIDETRTKLKIHSPSKVFEEIGGEIVAGLAAGLGVSGALSISGFISGIINDAKSAVSATLSFAGDSINKASDLKATTTQLTALVGSTTNATESLKFLRSEADKLALPFLESTKAYTQLTAATNGTKLSSSTKDIFDGFSTAARAAQLSTVDFSGAMLGLIQMIGKGKITSQDLRQITDRLPGAMQLAAKSVGLTAAEFQKLSESGELTTNVFLPRFAKALKEANVGTIAEATDTSTASLTKLNNRLDEVKIALGAAIEPGVVAGLGFAEQALNELGKAGLFDDLNAGAKEFASYLKDNPQLARQLAQEFRSTVQTALKNVVGAAKDLGDYLQKNPDAIHRSVEAVGSFVNSLKDAVSVAGQLIKPFADIANFALQTEQRLSNAVHAVAKNSNSNSSPARDIEDVSPFLRPVVKFSQLFGLNKDIGDRANDYSKNPVVDPRLKIIDSNDSKVIRDYAELTRHHANRGMESDRDYAPVGGKQEEIRRTPYGNLVKKDFFLENSAGSTNVGVPAPVSGYVRNSADYGKAAIYSQKQGGALLGQVLHLDPSSFRFKDGDQVQYGQVLGTQGGTGEGGKKNAYGVHSHVEVAVSQFKKYIQDIQDGVFDGMVTDAKMAAEIIKKVSSPSPTPTQIVKNAVSQSQPSNEGWMRTRASFYGKNDGAYQSGTQTASGIPLSDTSPQTAINENLKKNLRINWGDKIQIYNPTTKQSVVVSVVDSGPFAVGKNGQVLKDARGNYVPSPDRGFDLNEVAKKQLNFSGLGEVWFKVLGQSADYAKTVAQNIAKTTNGGTGTGNSTRSKLVGGVDPSNQPPEVQAALAGSREKDSAERRAKLRAAQQEQTQSVRALQDLDYSAIKNPSLSDRQAEESRKLVEKYNDDIRSTSQKQEDARSRIIINESKLKSGSVAPGTDEAKDLQLQIDVDKKAIAEYSKVLELLDKTRAKAVTNLKKYQAEQRAIQQRVQSFDLQQLEIGVQTANIQALKTFQAANPTDPRVDQLPNLERELALKQAQLNLDKQIASITDFENKNEITPAQADARLQLLDRENALQITNIQLTYQSAIAAQTLAKAKLSLAQTVRDNNSQVEFLRQDAALSEYGYGGNKLSLDNQANKIELQTKYSQDKVGLLETAKKEGFQPQTNGERLRLALRNNQSNVLNDASFKRQTEDKTFTNSQRLQQSNIDVLAARSESLQGLGLSTLDKPVQKQIAIQQQAISYASQINELQKLKDTTDLSNDDFITLKTNIEAINSIKLDSINQSFTDLSEVAKGFASDFQSVTKDFILNSSNIGESFSKLIQSLLSQFAQLASKQLSDQLLSFLGGKGKNQGSNQDNSVGCFLGSLLSSVGGLFGGGSGLDYSSFLGGGSSGDSFSFLGGFKEGGMVGDIAKSMERERLLSGNKAHLIVANEGERVLNKEQTQIYNRLIASRRIPNYAQGGYVGGTPTLATVLSTTGGSVSVGDINIDMGGGSGGDVNAPQLKRILQAQIYKTLQTERRPGGSLSPSRSGGLYDR